jgi:hypothetical protein
MHVRLADEWAADIWKLIRSKEKDFRKDPHSWGNCIHLFRLCMVAYYIDEVLGIRYRPDHAADQKAGIMSVFYTDPGDLFLNKVMDERIGTCGNMATLHLALGRRLGWPVTLTMTWSHFLLRFHNGQVTWNVEASSPGRGGFNCYSDKDAMEVFNIAEADVSSGSDLAFLTPTQVLGCFLALRARHFNNTGRHAEALRDMERAVARYPNSRYYQRDLQGYRRNVWPVSAFARTVTVGAGY